MKQLLIICISVFSLFMTGCTSAPIAPLNQGVKVNDFLPIQDKATLYIYRNEDFGAAIPMSVSINGKILGKMTGRTYFLLHLEPGNYNIESHAGNISTISLSVDAGKNYFLWQEVKMGMWNAENLMQNVDEKTGRTGVTDSNRITSAFSKFGIY